MNEHARNAELSLADLIGSRLCHDIVNPLGAIGNGVELMQLTGAATGPELDLIRDAVDDAQARIRFLRIAFGAAQPTHTISSREARTAVTGIYRNARMNPTWTVEQDLPRNRVKLAFLMTLCAETALPMGADLTVSLPAADRWQISATASRVNVDEALWSVLRFGPGALNRALRPAEAQFAALHVAAEELNLTVNYVHDEGSLTISTT